ncbi:MAG: CHAD domain-containing protein [Rubrivivax sp.]|nr:CHAD domain-containing protein [Rubrivivax sp.]
MTELELKFSLHGSALASLRAALTVRGARLVPLRARYFDTADARLARAGVSLRLRREGREWRQTLKAGADSRVQRFEHEVPVPPQGRKAHGLDLARHAEGPAQAVLQAALGGAPPRALVERFTVDVERLRLAVTTEHGSEIEIALDIGHVLVGKDRTPFAELELELKAGPPEGLFEFAQSWVAHGGLCLSALTKSQRGERAMCAQPALAVQAHPVALPASPDGSSVWRHVLRSVLDHVLANAGEVAQGHTDAELIHQLRVGLRRLRTALRELAALAPAVDARWLAAVGETFSRLGDFRDEEAMAKVVGPLLQAEGAVMPARVAPSAGDAIEAVRAPAFQAALVGLLGLAHAGGGLSSCKPADATRKHLARRLERLHKRVSCAGRRFDRLPLAQQHRVRKQIKRLRYLAEFVRSLWPAKAVDRYLSRLEPAQDALGAHNDIAVAAQRFQCQVRTDAHAAAAAGVLHAHLATTARAGRKLLRRVGKAPRFWG